VLNPIKKLAGQTAIYGSSSIIGRLLNYLLVPIYTRVFVTQDFGVFIEMYSYVAFLIVILTYGMETAFFRYAEKEKKIRTTVFSTSFISLLLTSSAFILLAIIYSSNIASILRYPDNSEYIIWLAIIVGLDALNSIPFAKLRSENKAVRFATIKLLNIGINIALNLFFIVFCPWILKNYNFALNDFINLIYDPQIGVGYIFISNLIASICTTILLLPQVIKSDWKFDVALWRRMIIYAIPLLIGGLAGVANEALDKVLLKYMLPKEIAMSQVGIYGACYKISIMMTIFIQAFRFAAEPFFFANANSKNAKELYGEVMKYFVIVCVTIFLTIMLFIDVVQHFVGEEYREGLIVVPILLLANMFLGIYFNLSIWYKLTGKTHFGAIFALSGAFITVILNIWWIPIFGYVGSAWATLACYSTMMILSYITGRRFYAIKYDIKKILTHILLGLTIYFVSFPLNDIIPIPYFIINGLLLIAFFIIIVLSDKSLKEDFFRIVNKKAK